MAHALIQLVSEQTLPNLFPALALRPAQTVLLHTPQTSRQCDWIRKALHLAGHDDSLSLVALPDNPDHHATGQAVLAQIAAARSADLSAVINITGGTKLMSIGAFAAAHQQRVPACYLDTAHRSIVSATGQALPPPLDSPSQAFRLIREQLTVPILAAAHGVEAFVPGRDPSAWLPIARLLLQDPHLEAETHAFAADHLNEGRRQPVDYERLLNTPLDGLPDSLVEPLLEAGHIQLRDGHWFLFHSEPSCFTRWAGGERYESMQSFFEATAPLQQVIGFLLGGWWELAVLETAAASGRFRDLHWSPLVTRPGGQTSIEEDLIAVEDLSLAVFSCKRGGDRARLLRALEELNASARLIGGSFANRYLAVAQPVPHHQFAEIQARASSSRTRLIGPAQRLSVGVFS